LTIVGMGVVWVKKITFRDDTIGVNQALESIGKKIAEKSRGVPLAIRSLGGVLQSKIEEREWIDVLRGEFWKMCEDNKDNILLVLKLSCKNLSSEQIKDGVLLIALYILRVGKLRRTNCYKCGWHKVILNVHLKNNAWKMLATNLSIFS